MNSISGNVVDQNNAALANAKVTLRTPVRTLAPIQFTYTDSLGNFSFNALGSGTYQITVTSDGLSFHHAKLVTINTSDVTNLNFAASALTAANS